MKYQLDSSCVIMSLILMTTLFCKALILQGEIWRWSLLGLKGLRSLNTFHIVIHICVYSLHQFSFFMQQCLRFLYQRYEQRRRRWANKLGIESVLATNETPSTVLSHVFKYCTKIQSRISVEFKMGRILWSKSRVSSAHLKSFKNHREKNWTFFFVSVYLNGGKSNMLSNH